MMWLQLLSFAFGIYSDDHRCVIRAVGIFFLNCYSKFLDKKKKKGKGAKNACADKDKRYRWKNMKCNTQMQYKLYYRHFYYISERLPGSSKKDYDTFFFLIQLLLFSAYVLTFIKPC